MAEAVEGIGGVFFRTRDPETLRAWYGEHLGIEMEEFCDLNAMLGQLRAAGVEVDEHVLWEPA